MERGTDGTETESNAICSSHPFPPEDPTGRVFNHPAVQGRDYILQKLITFHHQHQTPALQVQQDLQHVDPTPAPRRVRRRGQTLTGGTEQDSGTTAAAARSRWERSSRRCWPRWACK